MYSDNMIAQKIPSGLISDTNKWSHSSARRKQKKWQKKWQTVATVIWGHFSGIKFLGNMNRTIESIRVLNDIILYSNNMISQQSTSDEISDTNKWSHSFEGRKKDNRKSMMTVIWRHCSGINSQNNIKLQNRSNKGLAWNNDT